MALNFFPKVPKFFKLFGQQNDILVDTVKVLNDIFDDYINIAEKCNKIVKNEYAGNDVSKEIAKQLSITFITPIDREDIHAINMAQENILNSMRAISTRIGLYHFQQIPPGIKDLMLKLKFMIGSISLMLHQLSKKKQVEEHAEKVREIKVEADMLLLLLLGEIYERPVENTASLLEIIKWSHIYDRIEVAFADAGELANVLEGISLKNA
ncbi:MAG: DUF47 family protein [Bacteroidota bacterium]